MSAPDLLDDWLNAGQHWLDRVLASGLSSASPHLLDEGRHWFDQGHLLGWSGLTPHATALLDPRTPPAQRARALLDVIAWIATARQLQVADGLLERVAGDGRENEEG